jgi:hypothetical protein
MHRRQFLAAGSAAVLLPSLAIARPRRPLLDAARPELRTVQGARVRGFVLGGEPGHTHLRRQPLDGRPAWVIEGRFEGRAVGLRVPLSAKRLGTLPDPYSRAARQAAAATPSGPRDSWVLPWNGGYIDPTEPGAGASAPIDVTRYTGITLTVKGTTSAQVHVAGDDHIARTVPLDPLWDTLELPWSMFEGADLTAVREVWVGLSGPSEGHVAVARLGLY